MELHGKTKLIKLKLKSRGNLLLTKAIDDLLYTIGTKHWTSKKDVLADRKDADQVHPDGFYFFDLHLYRTLILLELDTTAEATIVWVGSHAQYERIFKNNKDVIKKWLIENDWI